MNNVPNERKNDYAIIHWNQFCYICFQFWEMWIQTHTVYPSVSQFLDGFFLNRGIMMRFFRMTCTSGHILLCGVKEIVKDVSSTRYAKDNDNHFEMMKTRLIACMFEQENRHNPSFPIPLREWCSVMSEAWTWVVVPDYVGLSWSKCRSDPRHFGLIVVVVVVNCWYSRVPSNLQYY